MALDRAVPTSGPRSPTLFAGDINEELERLYQLAPAIPASVAGTNTVTGTISPTITSYSQTPLVLFQAFGTNTGAMTVNWNAVAAEALVKQGGTAMESGDVTAGAYYLIARNSTETRWYLVGSVGGGSSRTILNGVAAPTSGDGIDGDFWIDTVGLDIYGPKTAGAWGSGTSLQGDTGAAGGAGISWEGAWVTATAYAINDAVGSDSASYICTVAHTSGASTEPGVGASWATVWDLLAAQGATGASGAGSGDMIAANNLSDVASAATSRSNLSAAAKAQTDYFSGLIASPGNQSYNLAINLPFAITVVNTTTKSGSGTCTATFKNTATALGGTANSVSSTEQTQAHASANTFAIGDDLVLTVSSNASCADLAFTIEYTRTLA